MFTVDEALLLLLHDPIRLIVSRFLHGPVNELNFFSSVICGMDDLHPICAITVFIWLCNIVKRSSRFVVGHVFYYYFDFEWACGK